MIWKWLAAHYSTTQYNILSENFELSFVSYYQIICLWKENKRIFSVCSDSKTTDKK